MEDKRHWTTCTKRKNGAGRCTCSTTKLPQKHLPLTSIMFCTIPCYRTGLSLPITMQYQHMYTSTNNHAMQSFTPNSHFPRRPQIENPQFPSTKRCSLIPIERVYPAFLRAIYSTHDWHSRKIPLQLQSYTVLVLA